ncbi:MAG TPA: hypothetical protein VGL35_14670 [Rhizomicrobium sp.]|jgi:hypothetical protein
MKRLRGSRGVTRRADARLLGGRVKPGHGENVGYVCADARMSAAMFHLIQIVIQIERNPL